LRVGVVRVSGEVEGALFMFPARCFFYYYFFFVEMEGMEKGKEDEPAPPRPWERI